MPCLSCREETSRAELDESQPSSIASDLRHEQPHLAALLERMLKKMAADRPSIREVGESLKSLIRDPFRSEQHLADFIRLLDSGLPKEDIRRQIREGPWATDPGWAYSKPEVRTEAPVEATFALEAREPDPTLWWKQNAWILKTINPSSTPLKTAIPRDTENRPHQVRRLSSALFSLRPGSSGSRAISSTAP